MIRFLIKDGATAVHWECDGGTEFDMQDTTKEEAGTAITLYLNEDSYEFANEYKCTRSHRKVLLIYANSDFP